jgi:putative nucleotidyltransferase with HDIG domain
MKQLKNILFVKEFSANIKVINEVITVVIIILMLLLAKVLYYTLNEELNFGIKVIICCAAAVLFMSLLAFRLYYVRSINRIADHANRYDALLLITQNIRAEKNISVLCEKILEHSITQTGAEAGMLLLYNGTSYEQAATRGVNAASAVSFTPLQAGGLTGICIHEDRCVRVNDISRDSRYSSAIDGMSNINARSLMCIPLKGSSGIIGLLKLAHADPDSFSQEDEDACRYISTQAAISIEISHFIEDHENFEKHMTNLLLQAMDNHLTIKVEHSRRVARYSEIIATAIGLPADTCATLRTACLLHDIGFIKFLPNEEMKPEAYLKHVTIGSNLLSQINFYKREAKIVLHHHERYDGSGYPSRLAGENIPLESRIIAIAEVFDAITSSDSYKEPLLFNDALVEIKKNSGTQFDPVLLDAFVHNIGEVV